ncbi:Amino-acid acetyltransferase, mitochondrial [Yamadazyma tenuis]|uniref:Amino-acid acetyltransferase, mitochondrial n=1 Tax=Candida tenuis (strain ATCC 10573 / BCRC 21748 / CBS 615 / JCM 9827 / NBRC 10315 / NRRL Y-1498 / VKM Y-70) TaxID=590646 RepID=G3B5L1_CANTC|nr:DUF619-domain-containing protein [Yamadazyma tenuis ATCC 10573]XP_006687503.1 uncharacterized protein CANTEDRAFT_123255 [Yamadazyma tenuis ATCC 10573]EGV63709.1 DUF619-domain-containing protein [Yamadazyma tenuis ATCC 10573]EGV63710.1 hypothetical protein CANTEDRAFT_123255 [Yamadazyma tenuis ATCC 10573]WEJ96929.1 Amino-acid acetyltransferase, mitochondrial [Yamadazyma tenuis]
MSKPSLTRQLTSNLVLHESSTNSKRNLILSILRSTTTKRETKNYLNKYRNQFRYNDSSAPDKDMQRSIFINRFLQQKNPFTNIYDEEEKKLQKIPLRIAIFKLKFSNVDPQNWAGIQETFKRLINLGASPIIVMDHDDELINDFKLNEFALINQGNRLLNSLKEINPRLIRTLFYRSEKGEMKINSLEQILIPMYQGFVPIIQPIVFDSLSSNQQFLKSDELLLSLCKSVLSANQDDMLSIEKVVFVDKHGGIPSIERNQTSHVFINLSQEYSDIISELYIGFLEPSLRDLHIENLKSIDKLLTAIHDITGNDETTGIITTPGIISINNDQLNPIIYNVLTDRPIISSSLPSSFKRTPQLSTSILKKGIDVEVLEPRNYPKEFTLENLINDNLVDKGKFFHLIEDSFGKPLDIDAYIKRINKTITTIIIVGDYDGGAVITNETSDGKTVPYLDKFAVAKKNQGLPGLADIIFKLIVQSNPDELIWRSRKNNPINKWYFERCVGSAAKAGSKWKLFYTGDIFNKSVQLKKKRDSININEKMKTYSSICESIPPSFTEPTK